MGRGVEREKQEMIQEQTCIQNKEHKGDAFIDIYVFYSIRISSLNSRRIKCLELYMLKGHCLIFLSAIYQLFIEYFNIK